MRKQDRHDGNGVPGSINIIGRQKSCNKEQDMDTCLAKEVCGGKCFHNGKMVSKKALKFKRYLNEMVFEAMIIKFDLQ